MRSLSILAATLCHSALMYSSMVNAQETGEAGYECDGSIVQIKNNGDLNASNFYCCVGDPKEQVYVGSDTPGTCTAGKQVPLTDTSAALPPGASSTQLAKASSILASVGVDLSGAPASASATETSATEASTNSVSTATTSSSESTTSAAGASAGPSNNFAAPTLGINAPWIGTGAALGGVLLAL